VVLGSCCDSMAAENMLTSSKYMWLSAGSTCMHVLSTYHSTRPGDLSEKWQRRHDLYHACA
jgi:hypothetical protein